MSYKSKRTLVSVFSGLLVIAAYLVFALGSNSPRPEDIKTWATAMLIFIGIGIVVTIVVQILFHVFAAIRLWFTEANRDDKMVERIIDAEAVEDERDALISLKSIKFGFCVVGIGFIVALITFMLGGSAIIGIHVLLGAFAGGSIIEGCLSVFLYEKSVRNG